VIVAPRFWLAFSAAAFLAACAGVQPTPEQKPGPTAADWRRHAERVASLEDWFLKGRIAVRTADDSWSATLHWRQQGGEFNLRVLAPLGQGSVELQGRQGGEVILTTSDNQRYVAADAESLMQSQLGWSVPVAGLEYWVRGLPAPGGGIDAASPDDRGRIRTLSQRGWRIEYRDYTEALERELPRKMNMVNDHLQLKLVVQSWEPVDA